MAGWWTFLEQQRAIGVGSKVTGVGTGAERAVPEGDNSLRPARPCDEGAATRGRRRSDPAAPKPAAAIAAVRREVRRSGDRRDTAPAAYSALRCRGRQRGIRPLHDDRGWI